MKVLVVEAEEATLKATGIMLNKLGYKVGLAASCDEAFRLYCNEGPHDVVLIALKFVRATLKNAALLALIGTILITSLLLWTFVLTVFNVLRDLVPAVTLLSSFIYAFGACSVAVFFYAFHSSQ